MGNLFSAFVCPICKEGFEDEELMKAHGDDTRLCIESINCKLLYLDHQKLNEDYQRLRIYNKRLIEENKKLKIENIHLKKS